MNLPLAWGCPPGLSRVVRHLLPSPHPTVLSSRPSNFQSRVPGHFGQGEHLNPGMPLLAHLQMGKLRPRVRRAEGVPGESRFLLLASGWTRDRPGEELAPNAHLQAHDDRRAGLSVSRARLCRLSPSCPLGPRTGLWGPQGSPVPAITPNAQQRQALARHTLFPMNLGSGRVPGLAGSSPHRAEWPGALAP